jgi:hypothetical protein
MKRIAFTLLLAAPLAHAGLFGPSDYAECLLDHLPKVENDLVARQIVAACLQEFPGGFANVETRSGWLKKYPDRRSCLINEAKSTKSAFAAQAISVACFHLYEPAPPIIPGSEIEQFLKAR